ncbi:MAG: hypothetical protein EXR79_07835 [Myxococcales bacterium]|nr:hypothetical protein [Myxococcales bacterium]
MGWAALWALGGCAAPIPPTTAGVGGAVVVADSADRSADGAAADAVAAAQEVVPAVATVADAAAPIDVASPDAAAPGIDVGPADVPKPIIATSGLAAPEPKALPKTVAVKDSTGYLIDPADLVGKWTVMWFYPAAQTSG